MVAGLSYGKPVKITKSHAWALSLFMIYWISSSAVTWIRAESRFAPSQWETLLQCNAVSHWLGVNLESALCRILDTVIRNPYYKPCWMMTSRLSIFSQFNLISLKIKPVNPFIDISWHRTVQWRDTVFRCDVIGEILNHLIQWCIKVAPPYMYMYIYIYIYI